MSRTTTTGSIAVPNASSGASASGTSMLLACGVVAGPLFIVVALVQAFTRPGFDLRRLPISMLSLGDLGWVQTANFVITGLLAIALATGARRALHHGRAGTWGPVLIGAYGIGMLCAGAFGPDPAFGFPPGAPAGMPAATSWHAMVHNLAFFVAFIGLIAACFVFARRFIGLGQRLWAVYCAATGVAAPALIAFATTGAFAPGVTLAAMGVVTSAWVAAIAVQLLSEQGRAQPVMG